MEPMLTVDEIAALLKRAPFTVRKWLRDKKLIGIRIGRDWRVKPDDLARFVAERESCAYAGAKVAELVARFYADCAADDRTPNEENLRAWLWFVCPAELRTQAGEAIAHDERFGGTNHEAQE